METELKFHFNPGDHVVIKDWDEMEMEYGLDSYGSIKVRNTFVKDMKYLCGEEAIVRDVNSIGDVSLDFVKDLYKAQQWSYSTQMIRPKRKTVFEAKMEDIESLWF